MYDTTSNMLFFSGESTESVLQSIYRDYYEKLCKQVYLLVRDSNIAEDIVQEVIVEIWNKKDQLNIQQSLEAYLKRACKNRSLNHLRDQKVKWEDESELYDVEDSNVSSEQQITYEELEQEICSCIDHLPEKCRLVFTLSRFEDMSYNEIADNLGISIKTVENQISKALRILREKIYKKSYEK